MWGHTDVHRQPLIHSPNQYVCLCVWSIVVVLPGLIPFLGFSFGHLRPIFLKGQARGVFFVVGVPTCSPLWCACFWASPTFPLRLHALRSRSSTWQLIAWVASIATCSARTNRFHARFSWEWQHFFLPCQDKVRVESKYTGFVDKSVCQFSVAGKHVREPASQRAVREESVGVELSARSGGLELKFCFGCNLKLHPHSGVATVKWQPFFTNVHCNPRTFPRHCKAKPSCAQEGDAVERILASQVVVVSRIIFSFFAGFVQAMQREGLHISEARG